MGYPICAICGSLLLSVDFVIYVAKPSSFVVLVSFVVPLQN